MNFFAIMAGLVLLHVFAINGMSLITATSKTGDFLKGNKFLLSRSHAIGFSCLIFSGLVIFLSEKVDALELGLVAACLLIFVDLYFIGRYFIYGGK